MNGWWVSETLESQGAAVLVAWVVWVILSICLHELGHGVAALWQGDTTPRDTGHMTLNPVVHMPPMSLLFFAIIGFAWGLMPVNPSRFRSGWRGVAAVAFAGPLVNVLLAVVATILWAMWVKFGSRTEPLFTNVENALGIGVYLNCFLFLFNMLPVPPLDGSSVLAGLVPPARGLYGDPRVQAYGMFALLGVLFLGLDRWIAKAAGFMQVELHVAAMQVFAIPLPSIG